MPYSQISSHRTPLLGLILVKALHLSSIVYRSPNVDDNGVSLLLERCDLCCEASESEGETKGAVAVLIEGLLSEIKE